MLSRKILTSSIIIFASTALLTIESKQPNLTPPACDVPIKKKRLSLKQQAPEPVIEELPPKTVVPQQEMPIEENTQQEGPQTQAPTEETPQTEAPIQETPQTEAPAEEAPTQIEGATEEEVQPEEEQSTGVPSRQPENGKKYKNGRPEKVLRSESNGYTGESTNGQPKKGVKSRACSNKNEEKCKIQCNKKKQDVFMCLENLQGKMVDCECEDPKTWDFDECFFK